MSDAEIQRYCEWAVDAYGGEGTAEECNDDSVVVVGGVEDCVSRMRLIRGSGCACDVTVGQLEACDLEAAEDLCAPESPGCAEIDACLDECAR